MQPRPAVESRAVLVRWMNLTDANSAGFVHGGTVMRLCDEAAGIAAIKHARMRVVTAGMDRMTFLEPVLVGQLVTFRAMVNAAWRTSLEVGVRVEAEDIRSGSVRHVSTAYLTMVALGEDGRPCPVPALEPSSEDEKRRQREAEWRRENRLSERQAIVDARTGDEQTSTSSS